jgi:pyruvate dehydrogenase E2 component (dihydrolipoamide acetyltransferase)
VPQAPHQAQGEASTPPQEKVANVGTPQSSRPAPAPPRGAASTGVGNGGRLRSSPLARRLASERGLDLGQVQGSGPGGRIIKRDIEEAATQGPPAAGAGAARPAPAGAAGDFEDVPLTQIRKTIARRLSESIGPVPTFYLTAEFDVSRVAEARSAMAAMGDEFKASFNDIILKAVATALREHREVNAQWLGDRIRYYNRVHVGMAVATDDGLIVPVIFDADQKSLRDIAREARELAKRARERKLTPEQYTGATFSVSNLGMFGIDQFTAIINPPEAGILAVGAIEEKPVVVDGAIVTRPRLRVTMSCDHRVIDGAVGARFLQTLRRMLENPLMLVF